MAFTGGPLNELNGKMGISSPHRSVPVMKLIRHHQPQSKAELADLIKFHFENDCPCGVKSQGTVEDFGQKLFESQAVYWGKNRFTLQQCIEWEYDLFVTQSLKGGLMEKKAISRLKKLLPNLIFEEAEGFIDEELRVDILVKSNGIELAGIQVKPETFHKMRESVILFNRNANLKWGKPVFYLIYDNDAAFVNFETVVDQLKNLAK